MIAFMWTQLIRVRKCFSNLLLCGSTTHTHTCTHKQAMHDHNQRERERCQQPVRGHPVCMWELKPGSCHVRRLICEWSPQSDNVTLYRVIVGWWFGSGWRRGSARRRRRAASALQGEERERVLRWYFWLLTSSPSNTHTHFFTLRLALAHKAP